ncbi:hypothetical protein OHA21_15140 [Actinoplanes sp. NBC_00393]|uniref:hypothetical protein n=1 Tax=Actinoplanes sp. NBC_00393 TaxID=2975953 RepID=UPI002E24C5A4
MESTPHRCTRGRTVLSTALTFLLGVTAGVSIRPIAAPERASDARARPAAVVPQVDRTVDVIPASCRSGLDRAQRAATTLEAAAQAVGELESARLQQALNRLQQAQRQLDALAVKCRAEMRDRAVVLP